jgi:hypothetical protein
LGHAAVRGQIAGRVVAHDAHRVGACIGGIVAGLGCHDAPAEVKRAWLNNWLCLGFDHSGKKFAGKINWDTGNGVSVREIADIVATMLGHPELVENQNPPTVDLFPFVVANAKRLQNLGWRQQVDLQTGLSHLIKTFTA